MRFRPTIVVLAAGSGSRFGGSVPKLQQPFGDSTVLGCTVQRAVQSQLPVLVVTTAALAPLLARQLATRDILTLSQGEAAQGIGTSIAAGVAERSGAPGWLLLPGDMPLVHPDSLLAVAGALEQHPVTYAQHKGWRGHPQGFAAELYGELIQLRGDEGARRVMHRYPAAGIELADRGVLLDVDTPADLEAMRALLRPAAVPAKGAAVSSG